MQYLKEQWPDILQFHTLEDMAALWDTHDLTDFEDDLIEVTQPVFQNFQPRAMTVMPDQEHYALLRQIAEPAAGRAARDVRKILASFIFLPYSLFDQMRQEKSGKTMSLLLNVHSFVERSTENGPGARAVLWVQGCTRRCPGCGNPDTHSRAVRTLVPVTDLAERIGRLPDIEGLTISGGEPFLQAAALAALGRAIHEQQRGLVVFTGFTLDELRQSSLPARDALLAVTDLLAAGPFIQAQACKLPLRGSRNQTLHFLTNRYRAWQDELNTGVHGVEILIDAAGEMIITGFPDQDFW